LLSAPLRRPPAPAEFDTGHGVGCGERHGLGTRSRNGTARLHKSGILPACREAAGSAAAGRVLGPIR
jgi:hypothetical protein